MEQKNYTNSKNLNSDSNFPYLMMDVKNGISSPQPLGFRIMHWHEDLQIVICLSGKIKVRSLYEEISLDEREAIFINKNVVHQIQSNNECHYKSILFPLYLVGGYTGSPAWRYVAKLSENNQLRLFLFSGKENWEKKIIEAIFILIQLEESKPDFYECEVLLNLYSIVLEMLKHMKITYQNLKTITAERVTKSLKFIALHYDEDLSLEEIATSANISQSECLRCFHQILQTTPYKYLTEYRIQKAAELLEHSNLSIGTIASQTGFNQISYFGKCFKQNTKMSPKEYRKQFNRLLTKAK